MQYIHESVGSNFRMTEFQSSILLHSVASLSEFSICRNVNALYLDSLLTDIDGIEIFQASSDVQHGRHLYPFRFKKESFQRGDKRLFIKALVCEGIPATSGYPLGVHEQPVFQNMNFGPYTGYKTAGRPLSYKDLYLPETARAVDEVCFLPQQVLLGNRSDMEDISRAVEKVAAFFRASK